jgi:RNA polymerase sigma factor (sigma-70 family)
MATIPADDVARHLRKLALLRDSAGMTDGQLLESYVRHRDEAGFAALMRRHGPMVWGVCQRVIGDHHDAEDAFQATFLVLVRKAASIVPREKVGNWLYGVAHQTARKARATAIRRHNRERLVTTMPEPAVVEPQQGTDLRPFLDAELSQLPEKYRAAVILCDLSGKNYKEAARQLGCPEGTLAARLSRARTMLARRLARHGFTLTGAAVAAALAQSAATAAVPAAVAVSTSKMVMIGMITGSVADLAEEVLKTMLLRKLKAYLGVMVAAIALLGGMAAWRWEHRAGGAEVKPSVKAEKKDDRPVEKGRKRILRWQLKFNTKDGKEYASQLEALGAHLAIPVEGQDKYRVIRDLSKRPATGAVEDLSRVEHIFWLEDNADSVASLAKALGIKPVPKHIVVFLPKYVEDELLRKELAHARKRRANIKEENILETQFEFVQTKTGYDIKVASQHIE